MTRNRTIAKYVHDTGLFRNIWFGVGRGHIMHQVLIYEKYLFIFGLSSNQQVVGEHIYIK